MTSSHLIQSSLIPAGYLIGSIPCGYLIGRSRGIDVRTAGSGNIGATNVGRLLGRKFFFIVFVLDMLKGLLPTLAAGAMRGRTEGYQGYLLWLSVGLSTVVGHMYSLFLGFKGGKGVATSTGVVLGVFPYFTIPAIVSTSVWAVLLRQTRIMSIASIFGAISLPLAYVGIGLAAHWPVFGQQWPLLVFSSIIAGLIVFKHRANMARLRAGTEPKYARRPGHNGNGANGHKTDASLSEEVEPDDGDPPPGTTGHRRLRNP